MRAGARYAMGARVRIAPTCTWDQLPPRAVGTRRAFKAAARAARLLTPLACSSRTIGMTLAANWLAAALRAALARAAASAVGLGLPRRTPRALAASNAADVRAEIISRSCSA